MVAGNLDRCPHDETPLVSAEAKARVGARVGDYELKSVIGEGGTGVVYRGRHVASDKPFAIKILHDRGARNEDDVAQFIDEARTTSRIRHPNVVEVADLGTTPDGTVFVAMEHLVGESLRNRLHGAGRLPLFEAINILRQVARGLGAAHEAGVVHGSLKPADIFLCKRKGRRRIVRRSKAQGMRLVVEPEESFDLVKLLDFGMARFLDLAPGAQARAGAVSGTLHYLSPEQAQGQPADQQSDIYSLGAVFYEMVTGIVPFDGESLLDILRGHVSGQVIAPSRRTPRAGIDGRVDTLILRCLKKNPILRFASTGELCEALDDCVTDCAFLRDARRLPGIAESGIDLSEALPEARQDPARSAEEKKAAAASVAEKAAPAPMAAKPVPAPVAGKTAVPPVAEKSAVAPVAEKSAPVLRKPPGAPVVEKSAVASVLPKTTVAPVAQKPAAASVAEKPAVVVAEKPAQEPVAEKPSLASVLQKLAAAPVVEKPSVASVLQKLAAASGVAKPAIASVAEKAAVVPVVEKLASVLPAVAAVADKPTAAPVVAKPAAAPVAEKPATAPAVKARAQASTADDPAAAVITPAPTVLAIGADPAAAVLPPPPEAVAADLTVKSPVEVADRPHLRIVKHPEAIVPDADERPERVNLEEDVLPVSRRPQVIALACVLLFGGGIAVWAARSGSAQSTTKPVAVSRPAVAPTPLAPPQAAAPTAAPVAAAPAPAPSAPPQAATAPVVTSAPTLAPSPLPLAAPVAAPVAPTAEVPKPEPAAPAKMARATSRGPGKLVALRTRPTQASGRQMAPAIPAPLESVAEIAPAAETTPTPAAAPAAETTSARAAKPKPQPESEPPTPSAATAEPAPPAPTTVDDLVREAQRAWMRGHYAAAIGKAQAALKAEPKAAQAVQAYEIIATCSCAIGAADAAREAASHLSDSKRELVKASCEKNGVTIE
jgi:serine/threonine-protein kinase